MPNNYEEQAKTNRSVRSLLKKHHKCAILRPTGFGKTFTLTDLIRDYKKVLYIYPSAVIRDTVIKRYVSTMDDFDEEEYDDYIDEETIETYKAMGQMENCTLMTYAKLIRLTDAELKAMKYDLFIFDECHKMGAPKARVACEKMFAMHPEKHFVGATATPIRADNIDVVAEFFSDITPYSYTLFDAIESGLLKKPIYCYCTYDVEEDLKETALLAGQDLSDEIVDSVIKAKAADLSKFMHIPTIINDVCEEYAKSTSYMKFIVFFTSKKHMTEYLPVVQSWFKEAFPNHKQETLCISSRSNAEKNNVEKLDSIVAEPNKISLIACIDMLNLGYHIDQLTGIMMCRCTKSNTIFIQQLGRALSVGTNNSAIVFDIVDNLHRKAVYELKQSLADKKRKKDKYNDRAKKIAYSIAPDGKTIVFMGDNGQTIETQYHINKKGEVVDAHNKPAPFIISDKNEVLYKSSVNKDICKFTSDCFEATGHIATYRELLAKAIAEPTVQKCKYAIELHFRTWCHNHKVPYPISKRELERLYGLDKEDFYNEFCSILKEKNINYPLNNVDKLVRLGTGNGRDVPLSICAEARQVSMKNLLNIMFER